MTGNPSTPLAGWRVLVPRSGRWGDDVARALRERGGEPVIAPLIDFAPAPDESALTAALTRLQDAAFDWLVVTSATTVDELVRHRAVIADGTRVAAVGQTTASAMTAAGYRVDFLPEEDHSARGLLDQWPRTETAGRVLIPHSDIAEPTLATGLRQLGLDVDTAVAYRTLDVPAAEEVVADVAAGRIRAVLVTSGSVARQVQRQFALLPAGTVVACIGPHTAVDARAAGLTVNVIAGNRSAAGLVEALADYAEHGERESAVHVAPSENNPENNPDVNRKETRHS